LFSKTVGLKDAWEEKGKKEENVLMNTQKKSINTLRKR
jgi:glutaminyl-tRNA synthetase